MGVDAVAALVCGRLFDRLGFTVLGAVALVSALFAPLVFLGHFGVALLGMVLWGIGMGAQESIMRAAVGGMVPAARRGTAYGVFNSGYGVLWFAGSALMGVLYPKFRQELAVSISFGKRTQKSAGPLLPTPEERPAAGPRPAAATASAS